MTLLWSTCLIARASVSNTIATEETIAAEASEQGPEFYPALPKLPLPVHSEPLPRHQVSPEDFSVAEVQLLDISDLGLICEELTYAEPDTAALPWARAHMHPKVPVCIYELPASWTLNEPDWKRLWTNTAVLGAAYVTAMGVLECLPEGSTNWNKKEIQSVPFYKRWWRHVIKEGPEWDGDNWIFNFVLHPYAGAVYFMAARSNGFNFYRSLLYSACVSTIGWEFGVEGIMERPSIQDIFITPLVGSIMGEGFYRIKRHIVNNGYSLWGSHLLGNVVAFIVDPVNEVVGLFNGNPARRYSARLSLTPTITAHHLGFSFLATF